MNTISADLKMSSSQLAIDYGLKAIVPQRFKLMLRKLRRGRRNRAKSFALVNPDFAQRVNLQAITEKLKHENEPFDVKEHHWRQLNSGFLTFPLEASDIQSAAFGIESRHPFMDKRLVEYCLALPSEQKFKQGWSRFVLRQAMKDIIPPEIQWRGGKTNMTPSFQKTMLKYDKSLLEEAMVSNSAVIDSYVNTSKLSDIYINLIAKNKLKQNTVNDIWESITLYYWLKKQKK